MYAKFEPCPPRIVAAISIFSSGIGVRSFFRHNLQNWSSLAGAWTGSGSIALSRTGRPNGLRCRATYRVDGFRERGLQQKPAMRK